VALLHQYQREPKTFDAGDEVLEYIEVQPQDIAIANRLAHVVLGRSLDELPPQTRRFLQELVRMVDERSQEQGLVRSDVRFTRREVREWTGAGNSQVAVHLDRLQELEYLLVHAGGRGRLIVYELLYEGDAEARAPFFPGLADLDGEGYVSNLPALDPNLPDSEAEFPGCFRGASGGFPAGFRGAQDPPQARSVSDSSSSLAAENPASSQNARPGSKTSPAGEPVVAAARRRKANGSKPPAGSS